MSKARKKLESQIVPEYHDLCSPKYAPTDPSTIPFDEWFDIDINTEKWEINMDNGSTSYRDPQVVHLPPSLRATRWRRPWEALPEATFAVSTDHPNFIPDLASANRRLFDSEFVRRFVHGVETLCHLGNAGRFAVEGVGSQFWPTTEKRPWRPWHHVYSHCKAGKGQQHNPTVNKSGKYIVRLFWLGSWRKIYVDDLLPVDEDGEIWLPSLQTPVDYLDPFENKDKMDIKQVVELWPFLLSKALLKLASLTWSRSKEMVDFDIIQCLSGWIPYKMSTRGMPAASIWDLCLQYTSQYKWQDSTSSKQKLSRSKLSIGASSKLRCNVLESRDDPEKYVLVLCSRHDNCSIPDGDSHCLLIEQTRNVPLVKPSKEEDFPQWKRYRWLDWAIENDILPPKESATPIKCLKVMDPFRKLCNKLYGDDTNTGKDNLMSSALSGESKRRLEFKLTPNVTRWLDFDQVSENIPHLIVYFKPSKFPVKVRMSDFSSRIAAKETKSPILKTLDESMVQDLKEIIRPQSALYHRNEPVYVLSDSLSTKKIVINLTQVGAQQLLLPADDEDCDTETVEDSDSECGICLTTILERLKGRKEMRVVKKDRNIIKIVPNKYQHRVEGHLVLYKFKWYSDRVDDVVSSIRTYGSGTVVLNLKPGRFLFRLLIKTDTSYVTQILSDTPLCVGYLEEIYPLLAEDPYLIIRTNEILVKSFQDLIKSFGKEDYLSKLRQFFNCYKPSCQLDKRELLTIHEVFYREFRKFIGRELGEAELMAVRVLLKQWQFPRWNCNVEDISGFCYPPFEEEMEYIEIIRKATVVIQTFFRGVFERQMMKRHSLHNKHHKETVESLQRVHSLLHDNGIMLLQHFHRQPDVRRITESRDCGDDFENEVTLYQFINSTRIADQGWNFICRQTFYVSSMEPIVVRVSMFCDLYRYSVRVFDNDNGRETKIHTETALPDRYSYNANGYTVLCHGMQQAQTQRQLYYKLSYVVSKETTEKLLHFPHNPTKNEAIIGNYIPTRRNRICRFSIFVKSEHVIATLQFSTSYRKTKINVKLLKDEEIVREKTGVGNVLVPVIMLGVPVHDSCKKIYADDPRYAEKKSTVKGLHKSRMRSHTSSMEDRDEINEVYVLEVDVMDDSWPLTAAEWEVVGRLEADKLVGAPDGPDINKKPSTTEVESPFWTLLIISGFADTLKFVIDEKRDIEVKQIKMRWYDNDPTRYDRSVELRNKYLEENKMINGGRCLNPETRSLNPEIFEEEVLPPYEAYLDTFRKIPPGAEGGGRKLKSLASIEKDIETEFHRLVRYREYHENILAELERMEINQIENYNLTKDWYNGCRLESEKMMEDARKPKQKYIEHALESMDPSKKNKKDKKSPKKSKKK